MRIADKSTQCIARELSRASNSVCPADDVYLAYEDTASWNPQGHPLEIEAIVLQAVNQDLSDLRLA